MQVDLGEAFLDAVYGQALQTGDWLPALRSLRDGLGSTEIAFTAVDNRTLRPQVWETTGSVLTEQECDRYRSDFMHLDPKLRILALGGPGFLFNDIEHFDDMFIARDAFYQEYSRPLGTRHTLDLFIGSCRTGDVYLAAMRSPRQGPFDICSESRLRSASAHLVRALDARQKLSRAESAAQQATAALDSLGFGVAVVDGAAQLLFANAFARAVLARGSPLRLQHSRVAGRGNGDLPAAKIRDAVAGTPSNFRLSDEQDWLVSAIPLPPASPLAPSSGALAVLVFRCTSAPVQPAATELRAIYGLTNAEAQLAAGIVQGKSLKNIAAERNVKFSTVRWQLLAVMRKLGVNRQADIVRVLAQMTPDGRAARST